MHIHIDEVERVFYVACGPVGANELRKYRFPAEDLPPLPTTYTVTKMTMALKLVDV